MLGVQGQECLCCSSKGAARDLTFELLTLIIVLEDVLLVLLQRPLMVSDVDAARNRALELLLAVNSHMVLELHLSAADFATLVTDPVTPITMGLFMCWASTDWKIAEKSQFSCSQWNDLLRWEFLCHTSFLMLGSSSPQVSQIAGTWLF